MNKIEKVNRNELIKSTVSNDNVLVNLDAITKLANSVKTSPFAKDFRNENGDVDEGAIISNMALGIEMGLSPVASLMLGKRLNANAYFSVLRGRELGLDPISSISKVYNISTSNGNVIALAVDIIIAKILESGTEIHYIRDFKPTPMYKSLTGQYLGHKYLLFDDEGKLDEDFFLYVKDVTTKEELLEAQKQGKTIIYQSGITNVSTVRLVRKSNNIDKTFTYSLQEAIDAGLYNGFHSSLLDTKGKPLYMKGKSNWNNHPQTHLRHRPLSIGGRIVVADYLMGNYSIDEAIEIINDDKVQSEDDLVDYVYNNPSVQTTENKE